MLRRYGNIYLGMNILIKVLLWVSLSEQNIYILKSYNHTWKPCYVSCVDFVK